MVYAVIDTNVFVSAYMTHNLKSATSKVVQLLFKGEINILYNDEIIAEYVDVLSRPHLRFMGQNAGCDRSASPIL